jgi:phage FluMu gp28-like protein
MTNNEDKKRIRIPYDFTPRGYQLELVEAPQRFKIAVWSRRSGKSKTCLNEQVRKAVTKKGVYYYILPTYRMAKDNVWDTLVKQHVPDEVILRKNEQSQTIYYKNGSIQRFVGCEDPDRHRGTNVNDIVFDEFAEMDESIWTTIMQPVLRENNGTATFIFTPRGKNHAWRLLQSAKEDREEWFWSVKDIHDIGIYTPEQLAKIKSATPLAMFQQEYEVAFLDGAAQFFRGIREILYDERMNLPQDGYFQLGVDLAKYNDYTVITPVNINKLWAYPQDRFNQVDWSTQEARIEATIRRHGMGKAIIDSTGVGDPSVERLQAKGLPVEGFKFSEISRNDLLKHLAILIENKKIRIPNDEGLIAELESFKYEMGETGKIKLKSTAKHDDRVMSLALALHGLNEPIPEFEDEEFKLYSTTFS